MNPPGEAQTAEAVEAATRSAALTEGPGTRIGPYKLLQLIGEGGFGTVFMAEQERPIRRRVALKIIKLGMDTRAVIARFEAERQALAMMDHPNIARVLDAGATESGRPFFVMELVRGVPITEYCDTASLSAAERLELVVPVCQAVQHAHQKGIIHRDLKPSNILVTLHDGKPVPKVIDFGIAKATNSRLTEKTLFTEHRQLIGTPAYMSPEQAEMSGLDIDTRSDVYSLGVLLYELLTGAPPFDSKKLLECGFAEIHRFIREVEPPKPSTRVSTLGEGLASIAAKRRTEPKRLGLLLRGDLDWIVMKALEKDRGRRYGTAIGLAEDIQRHLSGQAVLAAPPSAAYRLRKFARRNRAAVFAAGIVSAALLIAAAGTSYGVYAKLRFLRAEAGRVDALEWDAYRTKILLANSMVAGQRWGEAGGYLAECAPGKRGWEWEYLSRFASSEVLPFPEHLSMAMFNGPGTRVLTSSDSGPEAWGLDGCRVPAPELAGHEMPRVSPDRASMLSLTPTGVVLFPGAGGTAVEHDFGEPVRAASFDPTGRRIAVLLKDEVRLLELKGRPAGGPLKAPVPLVSASVSATGRVAARGKDGAAYIWDESGRPADEPLRSGAALRGALFSPDGRLILTWDTEGAARLWEGPGRPVGEPAGHADDPDPRFSPDGTRVVLRANGLARLYDAGLHPLGEPIRASGVSMLEFSADSSHLLVAAEGAAHLIDREGRPAAPAMDCGGEVQAALFSPDGRRVLVGSKAMDAGYPTPTVVGRRLSLWSLEGVKLWEMVIPEGAAADPSEAYPHSYCNLEFSADGTRVLACFGQNRTRAFIVAPERSLLPCRLVASEDLEQAAEEPAPAGARRAGPPALTLSPAGDGSLQVMGAGGATPVRLVGHVGEVTAWAVHPGGTRVATAGRDRTVRFWETGSWREVGAFPVREVMESLAFSRSGTLLFLKDSTRTEFVWDSREPGEQLRDMRARAEADAAARSLVDRLLAGPGSPEDLQRAIDSDGGLGPVRRWFARERLKNRLDATAVAAGEEARRIRARYLTKERIAERAARGALPERVWQAVLRMQAEWKPSAGELNGLAWDAVKVPGADPERSHDALVVAREASAAAPTSGDITNTLGVALFRCGEFREAIEVLERAERQYALASGWAETGARPPPQNIADLAPIAMACFRLGDTAAARDTLAAAHRLMASSVASTGPDGAALLREADALIGGPAPGTAPDK